MFFFRSRAPGPRKKETKGRSEESRREIPLVHSSRVVKEMEVK